MIFPDLLLLLPVGPVDPVVVGGLAVLRGLDGLRLARLHPAPCPTPRRGGGGGALGHHQQESITSGPPTSEQISKHVTDFEGYGSDSGAKLCFFETCSDRNSLNLVIKFGIHNRSIQISKFLHQSGPWHVAPNICRIYYMAKFAGSTTNQIDYILDNL